MHAKVTWLHDQQYDAESHTGNHIAMDADAAHQGGPGPMEMVLMALCSCTSVDVVSILRKKREPLTSLTVSAVAEQATEAPRVFTHIQLTYHIGGGVSQRLRRTRLRCRRTNIARFRRCWKSRRRSIT